jgi:hypothetical protein
MSSKEAREYAERRTKRPIGRATFSSWGIPHYKDGRCSIYLQSVLDRHLDERIARLSQQLFGKAV